MVRGYEPDRRINQITRNETGYGLVGGNTQFRTFSSLTENDLNLRAGVVYRLKDDWEEISRLRFGYTGRIINDDFKQTEYNMITFDEHFDTFVPASRQPGYMQTLLENLYSQQTTFGEIGRASCRERV